MSPRPLRGVRSTVLLPAPGNARPSEGTVIFEGDTIRQARNHGERGAGVLDAGTAAVLPALSNGHDHGKPLGPLSYGVQDGPLETWLPGVASAPPVPQELSSLAFFARQARSGVATSMHLHTLKPPEALLGEAVAVAAAAEAVGVRTAFAVPLHDRQHLLYGSEAATSEFLSLCGLHPDDLAIIPSRVPSTREAMDLVDEIATAITSPLVSVQYGPLGPQWISDDLAAAVAERSSTTGRRIHMHLLETRRQREWADAQHPDGLLFHLDRLGLLSPRLSVAHGVHLRAEELDLLAERGVVVATNASSNLRLQNGVAPVPDMVRRGVAIAVGLDGRAFDDDADYLRELRLLHQLHAGTDLDRALGAATIWRVAVDGGARVVHGGPGPYGFAVGTPADVMTIDLDRVGRDVMVPFRDPATLILARATTADVQDLVVAGRLVVEGGRALGVDEPALWQELESRLQGCVGGQLARAAVLEQVVPELGRWYARNGHRRSASPASGEISSSRG